MHHFRALPAAIAFLMAQRGLNQRDLATRSGIAKTQISGYLTGKVVPQLPQLDRVIAGLGVDPVVFFMVVKRMNQLQEKLEYRPSGPRLRDPDPLMELLLDIAWRALARADEDTSDEVDGAAPAELAGPRPTVGRLLQAQRLNLESLGVIADLLDELAGDGV